MWVTPCLGWAALSTRRHSSVRPIWGAGSELPSGRYPIQIRTAGRLTETRFSAQNSRVTTMFTTPVSDSTNVRAYLESDFSGFNPPTALSPATLTVSGCGFIRHRSHTAELSFLEVSRSV